MCPKVTETILVRIQNIAYCKFKTGISNEQSSQRERTMILAVAGQVGICKKVGLRLICLHNVGNNRGLTIPTVMRE